MIKAALLFGILLLAAAGCTQQQAVSFDVIDKGASGNIPQGNYILNSKEQASQMLGGNSKVANVDFNAYTLIAVSQGEKSSGGYSITVNQLVDEGNKLMVYVEEKSPGKGCMVTQAITSPYEIVRIKKTSKPIEFQTEDSFTNC